MKSLVVYACHAVQVLRVQLKLLCLLAGQWVQDTATSTAACFINSGIVCCQSHPPEAEGHALFATGGVGAGHMVVQGLLPAPGE